MPSHWQHLNRRPRLSQTALKMLSSVSFLSNSLPPVISAVTPRSASQCSQYHTIQITSKTFSTSKYFSFLKVCKRKILKSDNSRSYRIAVQYWSNVITRLHGSRMNLTKTVDRACLGREFSNIPFFTRLSSMKMPQPYAAEGTAIRFSRKPMISRDAPAMDFRLPMIFL